MLVESICLFKNKTKEAKRIKSNLNGEVTAVDVISQEEVPGCGWITSNLKELHQIIKLAVHISTHFERSNKNVRENPQSFLQRKPRGWSPVSGASISTSDDSFDRILVAVLTMKRA